jgi:hypothetical protein
VPKPFGVTTEPEHYLTLDGMIYHRTDTSEVPPSFADVKVKLDDNGEIFDTVLTAGLVGAQVCDSGVKSLSSDGLRDTARPVIAWWIFVERDISPVESPRAFQIDPAANPSILFSNSLAVLLSWVIVLTLRRMLA